MSNDKSSLGTGLDSLLGSRSDSEGSQVSQISVDELTPGQYQPRTKMHKSTLEELSQSIKEQGVLQPLVVRRLASGRFEIVVGERRWRAAQLAGIDSVPAIIRDLNNDETAKIALIENLQREDLNSMDQARGRRASRSFCRAAHLGRGSRPRRDLREALWAGAQPNPGILRVLGPSLGR